jgi:DNA-binding response OmpR family regulator
MTAVRLNGRAVLVVEAEPQTAEDLEAGLLDAGAKVFGVKRLRDALHMAQHPSLAAAIVAQRLGDDGTNAVCRQLSQLGIPFMFHTRFDATEAHQRWPHAPVVSKPARMEDLVRTVSGMVSTS